MANPKFYIRRVMKERNLSVMRISERAQAKGRPISPGYIHNVLKGQVTNPGIDFIKALAAGLGRPQREVFAAFGVKVGSPSKQKAKPAPVSIAPSPKRKIGFISDKKK